MQIVCKLKREGGSKVTFGKGQAKVTYHFKPNEEGEHVCAVNKEDHAEKLLSVPEAYHELGKAPVVAEPKEEAIEIIDPEKMGNKELSAWAKEMGMNPKNKQSIADYAKDNYDIDLEFDKNVSCTELIREIAKIDLEEAEGE